LSIGIRALVDSREEQSNGIEDSITAAGSVPSVSPNRGVPAYGEWMRGCSPPRRARTGHVVMECVVERAAPVSNFPILSKTNYADWAAVMRVMLQARELWDAVNITTMDFTEDHMALEALTRAVPPELSSTITGKATTHIAWEGIKTP
jgi:hypothetical protein